MTEAAFIAGDWGTSRLRLYLCGRDGAVLDRRDKIGFSTPEFEWLRRMAPQVRGWLDAAGEVPFLRRGPLLAEFDEVMAGRRPFSWQVWRWINFTRWHAHVFG